MRPIDGGFYPRSAIASITREKIQSRLSKLDSSASPKGSIDLEEIRKDILAIKGLPNKLKEDEEKLFNQPLKTTADRKKFLEMAFHGLKEVITTRTQRDTAHLIGRHELITANEEADLHYDSAKSTQKKLISLLSAPSFNIREVKSNFEVLAHHKASISNARMAQLAMRQGARDAIKRRAANSTLPDVEKESRSSKSAEASDQSSWLSRQLSFNSQEEVLTINGVENDDDCTAKAAAFFNEIDELLSIHGDSASVESLEPPQNAGLTADRLDQDGKIDRPPASNIEQDKFSGFISAYEEFKNREGIDETKRVRADWDDKAKSWHFEIVPKQDFLARLATGFKRTFGQDARFASVKQQVLRMLEKPVGPALSSRSAKNISSVESARKQLSDGREAARRFKLLNGEWEKFITSESVTIKKMNRALHHYKHYKEVIQHGLSAEALAKAALLNEVQNDGHGRAFATEKKVRSLESKYSTGAQTAFNALDESEQRDLIKRTSGEPFGTPRRDPSPIYSYGAKAPTASTSDGLYSAMVLKNVDSVGPLQVETSSDALQPSKALQPAVGPSGGEMQPLGTTDLRKTDDDFWNDVANDFENYVEGILESSTEASEVSELLQANDPELRNSVSETKAAFRAVESEVKQVDELTTAMNDMDRYMDQLLKDLGVVPSTKRHLKDEAEPLLQIKERRRPADYRSRDTGKSSTSFGT